MKLSTYIKGNQMVDMSHPPQKTLIILWYFKTLPYWNNVSILWRDSFFVACFDGPRAFVVTRVWYIS